ncbi:hypothetical protein EYZ11_002616 [Aspergillus tanneri]|uniref:Rhodopsin domain-containing protein n=1 Tax=Aspergillus tanneri TaxID=1220188 RepID=A0A4S3JSH5_9EURO|nr:hypothetical protein EYZ11_002616 [Aspergillus tanneri]
MGRFAPDSWEPAVNIVTWFLMTTATLCVLTRLGTKYWIFRRWTTDDYLSIVSMVLCVAQSVAVSMAMANGYGEHFDAVSGLKVDSILKSQYAAAILFLTTLCLSKLALIHFIWSRLDRGTI